MSSFNAFPGFSFPFQLPGVPGFSPSSASAQFPGVPGFSFPALPGFNQPFPGPQQPAPVQGGGCPPAMLLVMLPGVDLCRLLMMLCGGGMQGGTAPGGTGGPASPGFTLPGLPAFPGIPGFGGSISVDPGDIGKNLEGAINTVGGLIEQGLDKARKDADRLKRAVAEAGGTVDAGLKQAAKEAEKVVKTFEGAASNVATAGAKIVGNLFGLGKK